MKKSFLFISVLISMDSFGQVGINTENPETTLHVVGNPTDITRTDGIIAPILTGDQLRAKNALYNAPQTGTLIYASTADSAPTGKTINITAPGYYYFDGTVWQVLRGASGENIYTINGTLNSDRIVTQANRTLAFTGDQVNGFNVGANALSVDMSNSRVGINNNTPTNTLDVAGTARVQIIEESNNSNDVQLVADTNGVIKRSLVSTPTNIAKGYLLSNFVSGSTNGGIYRIFPINPIGVAPSNFNTTTGAFTVQRSGIYKATITITANTSGTAPGNYVVGICTPTGTEATANEWISRASYDVNSQTVGRTFTHVSVLQLTSGQVIYFGTSNNTRILANPSGTSGSGIGTYFEIEYLSEN